MVDIIQMLAIEGTNARPGYKLAPKYITIHNTGNDSNGADADNHAKLTQTTWKDKYLSYHYCVDDHQIVQIIPDNEVAWHAGDGANGTGNRQSLAIEICENADGNLKKATDNAVELTAMLIKKYNIPLSNIVQHNRWTGKNCPRKIRAGKPYTWDEFIAKVDAIVNPKKEEKTDDPKTFGTDEAQVKLANTKVYASSTAKTASNTKTGNYYIWDNAVVNGRIRITNAKDRIGKNGQVTGWVDIDEVTLVKTTTTVTTKPATTTTTKKPTTKTFKKGDKVVVKKKGLFTSATAKKALFTKTGTYYIYDGKKVNGRYRVTNKVKNVGKKPLALYVSGWMEL